MDQDRIVPGGPAAPRLYVVPAFPLDSAPARESILSCARRRWKSGTLGVVAGLAIGLGLHASRGERAAYAQVLSLGEVSLQPVQSLGSARETILERLRSRRDPPLPALTSATELVPVSASDPARSRQLWMRVLAAPGERESVETAFEAIAAVALEAQRSDFERALALAEAQVAADRRGAERASQVLDLAIKTESVDTTGADRLILMELQAPRSEAALAASGEAARVGPLLDSPVVFSGLRSAATVLLPALLLGVLAIAPWSRHARGAAS